MLKISFKRLIKYNELTMIACTSSDSAWPNTQKNFAPFAQTCSPHTKSQAPTSSGVHTSEMGVHMADHLAFLAGSLTAPEGGARIWAQGMTSSNTYTHVQAEHWQSQHNRTKFILVHHVLYFYELNVYKSQLTETHSTDTTRDTHN